MIYMFRNMSKKDDLFKLEHLKAVFNEIIRTVSDERSTEGQTLLSYVPVPNYSQRRLEGQNLVMNYVKL